MRNTKISNLYKFVLINVLVLNLWTDCLAAPVGSPAQSTEENFFNIPLKIGFETDYIVQRKIDNQADAGDQVTLEGLWTAAKIGYTWYEWIETYLLLGGMDWNVVQKKSDGSKIKYFANREFAWGWGAQALLFKTDKGITVSADTRLRQQKPGMEKIKVNDLVNKNLTTSGSLTEWQVSLAVALDMAKVIYSPQKFRYIPYAGVKLSKVKLHSGGSVSGIEYAVDRGRASENYGVFLGCDIYFFEAPENENFGLNVEGRFVDELAVSVSVNYKF